MKQTALAWVSFLTFIHLTVTPLQASGSGSNEDEMKKHLPPSRLPRLLSSKFKDKLINRVRSVRLQTHKPPKSSWGSQLKERELFALPANNQAPKKIDKYGWLTQDVQEVQASLAASAASEEERKQAARQGQRAPTPPPMEEEILPNSPSLTTLSSNEVFEEQGEQSPLRPSFTLGPLGEKLTEPVTTMMRSLIEQKELPEEEKQRQLNTLETFIARAQEEYQLSRMFDLYEDALKALSEPTIRSPSKELNEAISKLFIANNP